jgi:hypothetical protein
VKFLKLRNTKGFLIIPLAVLLFGATFVAFSQSQTSFNDMGANTPNYKVIERVVKSNRLKLRNYYKQNWKSGQYRGAWERVMQYFPNNFYHNSSSENFMHHWFNPKGKLEMSVYNSKELKKAVSNLGTFWDGNIVNAYKEMRSKKDKTDANDFKSKLGPLEKYFLSKDAKKLLKKYLKGEKSLTKGVRGIYNEMLKTLREEGDHMFAAALLHEGMHAKVDNDQKVAQIHNDFKSCKTPVQWDEFRGYMAEVGYHANYYNWAMNKIRAHWGKIKSLLKDLEKFRNKPKPLSDKDKAKIERIKAKIKAHMVIMRVHLREIQQSLDRMKGLMDYFKKNYFKSDNPKNYKDFEEVKNLIDGVNKKVTDFTTKAQKAIDDIAKSLKDLEDMLNAWNVWASCQTPKPPTKEKHKEVIKKFEDVSLPTAPSTDAEKKEGDRKISRSSGQRRNYIQGPPDTNVTVDSSMVRDQGEILDSRFAVSAGADISSFKLNELNDYFYYLNSTWDGNISHISSGTGYFVSAEWSINSSFAIGSEFIHHSNEAKGFLTTTANSYSNEHSLNGVDLHLTYGLPLIDNNLDLILKSGVGYYWSTYRETEGTFKIEGKSNTIGFNVSGGLEYSITEPISIFGLIGYRSIIFGDFDNNVEFFQPSNKKVTIDLSGVYVQFGISFRF